MNVQYFSNCRSLSDLEAQKQNLYQMFGLGKVKPDQFPRKTVDAEYSNLKNHFKATEDSAANSDSELTLDEILEQIKGWDVNAEVCGKWLWVSGPNAYKHFKDLKDIGFRYTKSKKAFYWRPENAKSNTSEPMPMEFIREKYGSSVV